MADELGFERLDVVISVGANPETFTHFALTLNLNIMVFILSIVNLSGAAFAGHTLYGAVHVPALVVRFHDRSRGPRTKVRYEDREIRVSL